MTKLHDQFYGAVSDVTIDLNALTTAARRRGLAQRRARRSLATVGAAATVLAIATAGWALVPGGSTAPDRTASVAGSPTAATSTPAAPTRIDGRIAAALVIELMGDQVSAAVENDSIRGQGGVDLLDETGTVVLPAEQNAEIYAEFHLLNNRGDSTVGVNIQHWSGLDLPADCAGRPAAQDCRIEQLHDGDLLRTYRDDTDKPGIIRLVAELISETRDLRVIVASSAPAGTTQPVDLANLSAVATDPLWGFEVPAEYEAKGNALTAYTWIDSLPGAQPTESVRAPKPDVG